MAKPSTEEPIEQTQMNSNYLVLSLGVIMEIAASYAAEFGIF